MKFKLLLWFLGHKIKKRVDNDPDFKKKAAEKNCTVQIKTADNSKGRNFNFKNGEVSSKKGVTANPTVALVFTDAATGFDVLKSGKTMDALKNGSLKLEGDAAIALWFGGIAAGAAK